ncbi:hypothetical protein CMK11_22600 [Candidatus Poribacteria bacterium]|nr:hypothetical protein [Candidatus Poribacteria bacterium]
MRTSYFCSASLILIATCVLPSYALALPPGLLYLSEAYGPSARAFGSVAATPDPEHTGVGVNPAAGAMATASGWYATTLRVPAARVDVLMPDPAGVAAVNTTLTRDGYALAILRRPMRRGKRTAVTAEIAYRAAGRFRRVDEDGTSVHAFPDADLAVGATLSRQMSSRLAIGGSAKWLRSKYSDTANTGQSGLGWAFDTGLVFRPAERWRVGLVARNLSNGVSYPDLRLPRDPRREVVVGLARSLVLSDSAHLTLGVDARMPSARGTQGSAGASIANGDRFGVSVGYLRRVERLISSAVGADEAVLSDTRLWRAMGPSAGGWLRLGGAELSAAVSPAYLPTPLAHETHAVHEGRWQWSVGVSPAR